MKKERPELTPEQRRMRAQMGAYAQQAKHDMREMTRAATHASQVTRFENQVDPERVLPAEERARRAEAARKAYMRGLALKRSRAATLARRANGVPSSECQTSG